MSLVGNLEDLSLGDIMQIISLSQKSGVLALEGASGAARIVFRNGMVHAASAKGAPTDLRGVLVERQLLDGALFDRLASNAADLGLPVEELIEREGHLTADRIQEVLKETIESLVLGMFAWPSGNFSFDVRSELEPEDPQLLLSDGINAQYLAMEGMRIADESQRDATGAAAKATEVVVPPAAAGAEPSASAREAAEALFGAEALETEPVEAGEELVLEEAAVVELDDEADATAADVLVASVVEKADGGPAPAVEARADELAAPAVDARADELAAPAVEARADELAAAPQPASEAVAAATPEAVDAPETVGATAGAPAAERPPSATSVVLIDPDVAVVEWVKAAIQPDFARVHVFQQSEPGLARIRQYLIRGERPVVLISTRTRIDSLSGIHGLADFVARLKTQARQLVVIGLHDAEDGKGPPASVDFDGVLARPSRAQLRERDEDQAALLTRDFARSVHTIVAGRADAPKGARGRATSLEDVRDTTTRLQEASSRGEILPVVLDFAATLFVRVAMLIVRGDQVFAVAGRGIAALDVSDPLDSPPPVSLPNPDSGWIQRVIESGKPLRAAPETAADRELLARFGGVEPSEAYLGPIESGGSTIALLYGDPGQGDAPMPDTSGLEVVLQHAGLALERAALERALWEADASEG
jgi:hypothetical protein